MKYHKVDEINTAVLQSSLLGAIIFLFCINVLRDFANSYANDTMVYMRPPQKIFESLIGLKRFRDPRQSSDAKASPHF